MRIRSRVRSFVASRGLGSFGPRSSIGRGVVIRNKAYVKIGSGTLIDDYVYMNGLSEDGLEIGDRCEIRFGAVLDCWKGKGIKIGSDTFIGPHTVIQGQGGTWIGSNCLISGHVYISPTSHVFSDPSRPIRTQGEERKGIVVEDDVWIGCGCVILDGVRIGRGSVIGAGSVVTSSVEPFSVAYGVPARVRRSRGEGDQPPGTDDADPRG